MSDRLLLKVSLFVLFSFVLFIVAFCDISDPIALLMLGFFSCFLMAASFFAAVCSIAGYILKFCCDKN